MKTRKIPMRRCIGCMESKPKKELIRIVSDQENEVILDITGKAPGRGAYLCQSKACFELARKKRAISRNLDIQVSDKRLDIIAEEFNKYEQYDTVESVEGGFSGTEQNWQMARRTIGQVHLHYQ